jgi:hypothetical protein
MEETEPAQVGHVSNRFECPSPANRKGPRTCLAESGEMAARTNQSDNSRGSCISVGCLVDSGQKMTARTNQEGKATGSYNSVEKDAGSDKEDPKPSLVTSSALLRSDPDQEVVQEEATSDVIPAGWTRTKLEPDW